MISIDLKALLHRLNQYSTRSLEAAAGMCVSKGGFEVGVEHLLLVLLEDPACDVQHILRHYEIDSARLQRVLQRFIETEKTGNTRKPVFSNILIELIQEAWLLASVELNMGEIRSGVLLATLICNPRRYGLDDYYSELEPISPDDLRKHFADIVAGSREESTVLHSERVAAGEGATKPRGDTALDRFTVNFTERARAGEIDPVFCRDHEIRQMIDILMRRRKNNPILVGEAGVGKTAVVEGLALKIVEDDVPEVLKGTTIYALDLGLLQAGASVKGEFEQRLKSVISEIKAAPDSTIMFIDEAHTLIGAGGSSGSGDAANLLKPALARGEMRTMAATTWSEYKKYFEKDPALARRFQLVKVDEPSVDDAMVIMRGLREKYEQAHQVYVRDDAIMATASLAARYLSGRQLPDKSVDLLDTACARIKINLSAKPDRIDAGERRIKLLERELNAIRRDIETGTRNDVETLHPLEQEIKQILAEMQQLEQRWHKEREVVDKIVTMRRQLDDALLQTRAKAASSPQEKSSSGENSSPQEATEGEDIALSAGDKKAIKKQLMAAETELQKMQGDDPLIHFEVSPDTISQVVSDWTGIPIGNMVKDEAAGILNFGAELNRRIKGQEQAIAAVDRRIRSAKAGLGLPHAPIAVLLFVGPSGVGKTECALGVGDLLFGGERFVTSVNMSEFQEKHTVSRLIGSPPGYVGYGEGGVLTEAVRQRPYSVVVLDEVEKADKEVMNLFYQVFDKGVLADGEGREIDFKNTIIVLTSNLGADVITQMCSGDEVPQMDDLIDAIRPILSNHFKPALLARMDIVPFYPIAQGAMKEIVRLKLEQLGGRLRDSQRMTFQYDDAVIDNIALRCTEVETGARNIDYIVNKTLLPNISTEILQQLAQEAVTNVLKIGIDKDGGFSYQFLNE